MLIPTKYNIFEFSDGGLKGKFCPINDNNDLSRNRPKGRNLSFSASATVSEIRDSFFLVTFQAFSFSNPGKEFLVPWIRNFKLSQKSNNLWNFFLHPDQKVYAGEEKKQNLWSDFKQICSKRSNLIGRRKSME